MRPHRVLFVCIGNACRSQMAEAFASARGGDVVRAGSAGLWPASRIPRITVELMLEKNISLDSRFPKGLDEPLPAPVSAPVREWDVEDPIFLPTERQREIRDQIEALVRDLIAELRG